MCVIENKLKKLNKLNVITQMMTGFKEVTSMSSRVIAIGEAKDGKIIIRTPEDKDKGNKK